MNRSLADLDVLADSGESVYLEVMKRSEIVVLPADEPEGKIGFTVREFLGCPIAQAPDGAPIAGQTVLVEGSTVYVRGLLGEWIEMRIGRNQAGDPYAERGSLIACLSRGPDERGDIWVCVGLINRRALAKLSIHR